MLRIVEQLALRALLDDPARVHHRDPVGHVGHHAHVVRDQHDGGAEVLPELLDQAEDLRLDGDVQRGGRLVGDQHVRVAGHRHRDHDALAHAAGELVRVGVDALARVRDADRGQQLDGPVPGCLPADLLVLADLLLDLPAHLVDGIQRGHRVLEDHADARAADGPDLVL